MRKHERRCRVHILPWEGVFARAVSHSSLSLLIVGEEQFVQFPHDSGLRLHRNAIYKLGY